MNPAYAEHEDGEVDPVDIAPLASGNAPSVTAPASDDGEHDEDMPEDDGDVEPDEGMITEGQGETVEDMCRFLGRISGQIRAFNNTMQDCARLSQPIVVPDGRLWDTGLALDREFELYPDASRDVVRSRLYSQVWDLLRKMKKPVIKQTWKTEDQEIVEGLVNVMVLSVRNNALLDQALNDQVEDHAI